MLKKWSVRTVILFMMLNLIACSDDAVSPITTGTIEGTVVDAETGMPIAMVSITTNPGTVSITTDSAGQYRLPELEEGSYTVRAAKLGYKSNSVSVIVKPEQVIPADIVLEEASTENVAPLPPSNPTPTDGATEQPLSLTLAWTGTDLNKEDSLSYDIYLGNEKSPISILASDLADTTFFLTDLKFSILYYWQVVTKDKAGALAYSPVWRFSTEAFPDNRLVFVSNRDGNYAIYSASVEGESIIKLTENHNRNWWPRISPNRDKIAFTSDQAIEAHLFVMELDDNNPKKITTIPLAGYHNYGTGFSWSPEGTHLLFSHYDKLYRIRADGSDLTQIATAPPDRHFRECDWSPLGDKIVALTVGSWFYNSEIYLMNTDGTNMTVLMSDSVGAMTAPAFAPDGKKIVFTYDVSGHEVTSGRQLDAHIFILHIDGSDTIDVSINKAAGTNDLFPRWSPDGGKIIFCNGANDDITPKEIWVMAADGTDRKKLIDNGMMPDWR